MTESNTQVYYSIYMSPVGELLLTSERGMLSGLNMALQGGKPAPGPEPDWRRDDKALRLPRQQLDAYFEGDLQTFDLPLHMAGTPFQKQVWQGLLTIPYGTTMSYAELARRIGRPGAIAHRRRRQRPKPHRNHRPLPPRDRRQRHTHRLRRRIGPQRMADLARSRHAGRTRSGQSAEGKVASAKTHAYTNGVDRTARRPNLKVGAPMINRRDALKALAGGGVLAYSGPALAQSPSKRSTKTKKKKSAARTQTDQPLQSDARVEDVLGPIRDEHHLPGLIGAIAFARDWRPSAPWESARSARPSRSRSPTRCTWARAPRR